MYVHIYIYYYRYTHLHTCTISSAFIKVCIVWFGAFRFCRHKLWLQSSPWFLCRPIPFLYGLHRVVRVVGLQLSFMIGVRRCSTNSVPFYGGVGFKLLQWILDLRLQGWHPAIMSRKLFCVYYPCFGATGHACLAREVQCWEYGLTLHKPTCWRRTNRPFPW